MRVIIAGTRSLTKADMPWLESAITASEFVISEVVCGGMTGGDALGDAWAHANGIPVSYYVVTARGKVIADHLTSLKHCPCPVQIVGEWYRPDGTVNRAAGPMRNSVMAHVAQGAIILIRGKSPGSHDMLHQLREREIPAYAETREER